MAKKKPAIAFNPDADGGECGFNAAYAATDKNDRLLKRLQTFGKNVAEFHNGPLTEGPFAEAASTMTEWLFNISSGRAQTLRAAAGKLFGRSMAQETAFTAGKIATENEVALAKAIYADTQAFLRSQGTKEITLYRGVTGEQASEIQGALDAGVDGLGQPGKVPGKVTVRTNVLSSWTTRESVAEDFATRSKGQEGVVLKMTVPVEDIFVGENFRNGYSVSGVKQAEWVVVAPESGMSEVVAKQVYGKWDWPKAKAAKERLISGTLDDVDGLEWLHLTFARA